MIKKSFGETLVLSRGYRPQPGALTGTDSFMVVLQCATLVHWLRCRRPGTAETH